MIDHEIWKLKWDWMEILCFELKSIVFVMIFNEKSGKWMENDGHTMKQLVIWCFIGNLGCKRSLDMVGCWRNPLFRWWLIIPNILDVYGCLQMFHQQSIVWNGCLLWERSPEMVWFAAVWGGMNSCKSSVNVCFLGGCVHEIGNVKMDIKGRGIW